MRPKSGEAQIEVAQRVLRAHDEGGQGGVRCALRVCVCVCMCVCMRVRACACARVCVSMRVCDAMATVHNGVVGTRLAVCGARGGGSTTERLGLLTAGAARVEYTAEGPVAASGRDGAVVGGVTELPPRACAARGVE